jgi:hypothetical protein
MDDIPGYVRYCFNTGKLLFLALLVSGGIVLQILVGIVFVHDFIHKEKKVDNYLVIISFFTY